MKGAIGIVGVICATAVAIVKIATSHRENMEKIRRGSNFKLSKMGTKFAKSGFEN